MILNSPYITGSINVSGVITGSLSGSVTGSLFGTASQATSASLAATSSVAYSGTGSFSGSFSGSLFGTASQALTASYLLGYVSPFPFTGSASITGSLRVSGSTNMSASSYALAMLGSGSGVFTVDGTSGRLFQVDDSLSGSLFSVNTAAGLPVVEAFSDNTVRIGQFGQKALFVSQSKVGVGTETPVTNLDVSGSARVTNGLSETGSVNISGSITMTGSFTTSGTITAQTLVVQTINVTQSYSSGSNIFGSLLTNTQTFTGSVNITGSLALGGNIAIQTGSVTQPYVLHTVRYGGSSGNLLLEGNDTVVGQPAITFKNNNGNITNNISQLGGAGGLNLNSILYITASNVGIGTTSPTYKLEVSGSSGTFSFNPNQASAMIIRGSVTGNFDINNEAASGVMRLYGTSIQLRTAAVDPAVTITAAGGLQTNLSTISSFYSTPGNVASAGTTTFVYNQTSAEYAVAFEYCIIGLYAPSGTNLYGIAHGFAYFMADGATNASYISQNIANGWSVAVSATNAGVFTITFTNGGGATMSNINIRTRKINRIGAG